MAKYFFRLDDIAPNMNWNNFNSLVAIFKKHGIKPLLGVIPDNKDAELLKHPYNSDFWDIIGRLSDGGWTVAQHGYQHLYKSADGGILNINKKSEFSGVDLDAQIKMIEIGKDIIAARIGEPKIFMAPAHSFDKNTINALTANNFRFISDSIALYPFRKWSVIWLPQILWRPRRWPFGMITVALHPNTISNADFENLEKFIEKNLKKIGNFSELMNWHAKTGILRKFFTFLINQLFKIFWYLVFIIKHVSK